MTKPERQRYRINWSAIVKFGDHIKSICERDGTHYPTLAEPYGVIASRNRKQNASSPNSGTISVLPNYNPWHWPPPGN